MVDIFLQVSSFAAMGSSIQKIPWTLQETPLRDNEGITDHYTPAIYLSATLLRGSVIVVISSS